LADRLDNWELWACAQQVIKQHGANAPLHVATRIAELATDQDAEGVKTWQAIAERVDQLMDHRSGKPLSRQ
jgi:hypothetical protein